MNPAAPPLVEFDGVVLDHPASGTLRLPLVRVVPGAIVRVPVLDAAAAEVVVHLATGAILPGTGVVRLFGRDTREVTDGAAWLRLLEGLGLVSTRAVLIHAFSALQNIAMPLTLDVDPLDERHAATAAALAREAGLDATVLERRVSDLSPLDTMRTHLARALALDPRLIVAEHPAAALPADGAAAFDSDLARAVRERGVGVLLLNGSEGF